MARIGTDEGHHVDCLEHGDPHGRPVVLLAGFRAPATSWHFQVPALVEGGYRVVTVDLPGHGTAGALPAGVTMRRRGAFVHAALEELDVRDAVLVGGSMGANTIWAYAEQFGTGRLSAVATVDQTPKMLNEAEWPYGLYGCDETNVDTYFAGVRGTPEELTLLNDHARQDWRPTITKVDVPTLFIAGADSRFWPAEHATAAASLAPHGAAAIVDNAGHATNVEQPDVVNAALLRFLATR